MWDEKKENESGDLESFPILIAPLPDVALWVPEDERENRVRLWDNLCLVDGKRYFIQGDMQIPVKGEDIPFLVRCWVEVGPAEFARFQAGTIRGAGVRFIGSLANRIPSIGAMDPVPMLIEIQPNSLPSRSTLRVENPAFGLGQLQTHGFAYEELLEVASGYDPELQREAPPAERIQMHRRAVLRRFVERVSKKHHRDIPFPDDALLPAFGGVFGDLGPEGTTMVLLGNSAEEIVGRADQWMANNAPQSLCGVAVWDLDSDSHEWSRNYPTGEDPADVGPAPALREICGILFGPHGSFGIQNAQSEYAWNYAGCAVPADSKLAVRLRDAYGRLQYISHVPEGKLALSEDGKFLIWSVTGAEASRVTMDTQIVAESWKPELGESALFGLPIKETVKLQKVRLQQLEVIWRFVHLIADLEERVRSWDASSQSEVARFAKMIDQLNTRAGVRSLTQSLVASHVSLD